MGQAKRAFTELSEHLEGHVGNVALAGGYHYIYLNDRLLHIASIPMPNVLAERFSESTTENSDRFEDEHGNEFVITIYSSINGIQWYLEEYPDDANLLMSVHYDVSLNEH